METKRNFAGIARRVADPDDGQNMQQFMSDSPEAIVARTGHPLGGQTSGQSLSFNQQPLEGPTPKARPKLVCNVKAEYP